MGEGPTRHCPFPLQSLRHRLCSPERCSCNAMGEDREQTFSTCFHSQAARLAIVPLSAKTFAGQADALAVTVQAATAGASLRPSTSRRQPATKLTAVLRSRPSRKPSNTCARKHQEYICTETSRIAQYFQCLQSTELMTRNHVLPRYCIPLFPKIPPSILHLVHTPNLKLAPSCCAHCRQHAQVFLLHHARSPSLLLRKAFSRDSGDGWGRYKAKPLSQGFVHCSNMFRPVELSGTPGLSAVAHALSAARRDCAKLRTDASVISVISCD